jgi:lysyl-tRNA synthetase class 2
VTFPRQPSTGWCRRPPWTATGVARLVQATGALDIVSGSLPPGHHRLAVLAEVIPVTGVLTARAATVVVGMLLVYLGAGLRRGKHRAWQVAVVLSAAGVALHVVKGLDLGAAVISAGLLAMLVVTRRRFRAHADPRNVARAFVAMAGFAAAGFVLGFTEIALRVNRLVGEPGCASWAVHAALGLIGVDGPVRFRHPLGADAVSLTTGSFGLLAAGVALVLLLRPGARLPARTDADDEEVRALLARHAGTDSLGYFALRHDKSLMWSPSRKAVIAYRVVNGVSLAAGDPIGDPEAWPQAITAWLADCAVHGWTPAVLGCANAGGRAYRRGGLDVVEIGDEAVVDVDDFSLQGRQMRSVRQAVARVERAGYTCRIARQADLTPEELAAAVQAAASFRDGQVERGFSMALSRIGDPVDSGCLLVLCHDDRSRLRGVLQFVPWGRDGLSLDLMRGDRTAENGLMEFMLAGVLQAAPGLGIRQVSLNFAVLRSVFARAEELGAGPVLRAWHRILQAASRFWQIESLYRANAKYQPAWRPRYLCFPTARDLPRIAVAALKAEAFLPSVRVMFGSHRSTAAPLVPTDTNRHRVLTDA